MTRKVAKKACPRCGSTSVEPDWSVGYSICMRCNKSFTHAAGRNAYKRSK